MKIILSVLTELTDLTVLTRAKTHTWIFYKWFDRVNRLTGPKRHMWLFFTWFETCENICQVSTVWTVITVFLSICDWMLTYVFWPSVIVLTIMKIGLSVFFFTHARDKFSWHPTWRTYRFFGYKSAKSCSTAGWKGFGKTQLFLFYKVLNWPQNWWMVLRNSAATLSFFLSV